MTSKNYNSNYFKMTDTLVTTATTTATTNATTTATDTASIGFTSTGDTTGALPKSKVATVDDPVVNVNKSFTNGDAHVVQSPKSLIIKAEQHSNRNNNIRTAGAVGAGDANDMSTSLISHRYTCGSVQSSTTTMAVSRGRMHSTGNGGTSSAGTSNSISACEMRTLVHSTGGAANTALNSPISCSSPTANATATAAAMCSNGGKMTRREATQQEVDEVSRLFEEKPEAFEKWLMERAPPEALARLHEFIESRKPPKRPSVTSDLFQQWMAASPVQVSASK